MVLSWHTDCVHVLEGGNTFSLSLPPSLPPSLSLPLLIAGQSSARVKRRLRYLFSQAIQHHPSVLLLDDIEHAMPQVSDAQEQITEEGTASIKKTLGLLYT